VSRYIYTAKLVPIGKAVKIPCEDGGPCVSTFNDKSLEIERTSKTKPEIWVGHDQNLRIGNIAVLYTHQDWWMCDFGLDRGAVFASRGADAVSVCKQSGRVSSLGRVGRRARGWTGA
jgi:hypothetical protein